MRNRSHTASTDCPGTNDPARHSYRNCHRLARGRLRRDYRRIEPRREEEGSLTVVAIILNDWLGYEPARLKRVGAIKMEVGAGPILANLARYSAGIPFFVILVLNEPQPSCPTGSMVETHADVAKKQRWQSIAKKFAFVRDIQFRSNVDFDIGAYEHGLRILRRGNFDGDVLFMNSSLRGPGSHKWLAKYHALFHERDDIGLCGITLNALSVRDGLPELPHVQSFFLYTSMRVLQKVFPARLYQGALSSRQEAILRGEIGISQAVLHHGYAIRCAAFPDFMYKLGDAWQIPLVLGWRRVPELAEKYANTIL